MSLKEEATKERELIKSIREKEKAFHAEQREAARDSAEQAKAELQKAKEKQKEEKATYHRPVFRQESVLGNESRMSSISEIMRLADDQGLSYAEYMARRNS